MGDFWVFGYGSLIWRPGFEFLEERPALLRGRHRALCVRSYVHRGTPQSPGLVLGLDRGGACRGLARRVAAKKHDVVVAYLRERELVTHVYKEVRVPIALDDGRKVQALTYVVDRKHEQYAPPQPLEDLVECVRHAQGKSGKNPDYVISTVRSLAELGIHDSGLEAVARKLQEES